MDTFLFKSKIQNFPVIFFSKDGVLYCDSTRATMLRFTFPRVLKKVIYTACNHVSLEKSSPLLGKAQKIKNLDTSYQQPCFGLFHCKKCNIYERSMYFTAIKSRVPFNLAKNKSEQFGIIPSDRQQLGFLCWMNFFFNSTAVANYFYRNYSDKRNMHSN